jgi:hypothetical protein
MPSVSPTPPPASDSSPVTPPLPLPCMALRATQKSHCTRRSYSETCLFHGGCTDRPHNTARPGNTEMLHRDMVHTAARQQLARAQAGTHQRAPVAVVLQHARVPDYDEQCLGARDGDVEAPRRVEEPDEAALLLAARRALHMRVSAVLSAFKRARNAWQSPMIAQARACNVPTRTAQHTSACSTVQECPEGCAPRP